MKNFEAIVQKAGRINKVIVAASSIEIARSEAKKHGRVVGIKRKYSLSLEPTMSASDRQILLHRLSAMLKSKMGQSESLQMIAQHFSGAIQSVAKKMLVPVERGHSLAKAMIEVGPPNFPKQLSALIDAGFRSGNSADALKHGAEFEREMDSIKRGNMGDVYNGLILFFIAAALIFGTTMFMGPYMLESEIMAMAPGGVNINPIFSIMALFSEIIVGIITISLIGLLALGTLGRIINPIVADSLILKIPFYKDLILAKNNYTTFYSLGLLVKAGVPMEKALKLSAETSAPGALREDLIGAVRNVSKGVPWAKAMATIHPTDRAALSAAQDREGVIVSLNALSDQYKALYLSRIRTLAPVMKVLGVVFMILSGVLMFGLCLMPMLELMAGGM